MAGSRRNTTRFALWGAVGLCVALAGCNSQPSPPVGGSSSSKADKARKDAESLAVNSIIAGAEAQVKANPSLAHRELPINVVIAPNEASPAMAAKHPVPGTAPSAPKAGTAPQAPGAKTAPTPKSPQRPGTIVRERVVSSLPYATEAEAEEDALALARDVVERKLAALDPPVRYKPTAGEIAEFVRKDSRVARAPTAEEKEALKEAFDQSGLTGNLIYVEYDVEVTSDQVRELRAQERVAAGMRILGMMVAVALAGFLFLRADEWTKGYLTRWLAFAAVLLAGGVAAALIFV